MSAPDAVAFALAAGFLAGRWLRTELIERGAQVLGQRPSWLPPLARAVLRAFPRPPSDDLALLRDFILHRRAFEQTYFGRERPRLARLLVSEASAPALRFPTPALASVADVALWLGLELPELDWYADVKGLNRHAEDVALQHYSCSWRRKAQGGVRLLEAPKSRLKALQRRILHELLDHVPAHDAAHGFVRGRSPLSYVAPHTGRDLVLRLDLSDFFGSVHAPRVYRVFRTLGYADEVSRVLMSLCTSRAPEQGLSAARRTLAADVAPGEWYHVRQHLAARHLPQGAPTSPALANLCCFRLDQRLSALARALGADYTRYADDLAFSGGRELARRARHCVELVRAIAGQEGFRVHPRKTRVMTPGARQKLAGLVINQQPAVERRTRKLLEARLLHAARGPCTPQELAELTGKVGWVEQAHAPHAVWLRELLGRVRVGVGT